MKAAIVLLLAALPVLAQNSCLDCHAVLPDRLGQPAKAFANDIHAERGLACVDCHGGDPTTDDPTASKSRARGFRGKFARTAIPEMCARCHSHADYMHKFNPRQRVDQLAQYRTSVHGKQLAKGDTNVAQCTDCHGAHGIIPGKHANSPVHPLKLPETCARCHTDAGLMARYKLPATQLEEFRGSVHWKALSERGDLSAPGCASCHGNHGATPPEVASVAAVCGSCHVLMQNLFSKSHHREIFESMGAGGCSACHGDHKVLKPSPDLLVGERSVCAQCHEETSAGGKVARQLADAIRGLDAQLQRSEDILTRARRSGMEVSEAELRLMEGREEAIKARVAVHTFDLTQLGEPVKNGLEIAAETYRAGESAMRERNYRRIGLGLSLITIIVTMAGLWLAIRRIEGKKPGAASGA